MTRNSSRAPRGGTRSASTGDGRAPLITRSVRTRRCDSSYPTPRKYLNDPNELFSPTYSGARANDVNHGHAPVYEAPKRLRGKTMAVISLNNSGITFRMMLVSVEIVLGSLGAVVGGGGRR